jgi:ATP-binding protein involved in chromosome partitioning
VTGSPVPERIHRGERDLTITWEPGHVSTYAVRQLRLACQCASCRDEFTGSELLDPGAVPEDLRALEVSLVGNYAIKIRFSDGHDTGIYTYRYLLELCSCERCTAARTRPAAPGR